MSEKEITPSLHPLEDTGGSSDMNPDRPEPVEGLKDEQPVVERADKDRRAAFMERIALVLVIGGFVAVLFYVLLYVQIRAWQILAEGGALGLTFVSLIVAYRLIRRGKLDAAGYWMLFALLLGFGAAELFLVGATWYIAAGGILLIIVAGRIVLPYKWVTWMVAIGLFVVYVFSVNRFEPLPRYDVGQSMILRIFIPGMTGSLALAILWQIVGAFRIGTIRTRLLISFLVLALLPAITIAIVSGAAGFLRERQQVYDQLESVAALKEAEIETWVNSLKSDLSNALSGRAEMQHAKVLFQGEAADPGDHRVAYTLLQGRFQREVESTEQFDELFFMDLQGQVVLSTDTSQEGNLYGHLPFFQEGLRNEYVHPPVKPLFSDQVSVYVVRPIKDEQEQVLGVMAGRASPASLREIVLEWAGLGTTGETYLVRSNYTMLTESRFVDKEDIQVRTEGVEAAVGTKGHAHGMYADYRGVPTIGVYHWLTDLQAVLVAKQDQAEVFGTTYQALAINAGVALVSALLAVLGALFVTRSIANPLADLAGIAAQIAGGDLARVAQVGRRDEIGALAQAFNSMTAQLRELIGSLEQRVAERTQVLAYRSVQLETAAQVSQAAGSVLDARELERLAVELIHRRFGYYYVGLFLVDKDGEWTGEPGRWAVLRAGTGEAGRAMLDAGHKLEVGGESMIGRCVAEGRARIALDVGKEATRFDNPLLPETRSEMALPLTVRGQVIGAFTVQSEREAAFSEEDISILQTMVTQVGNGIQNARLFEQTQAALAEAEMLYNASQRVASAVDLQEIVAAVAEGVSVPAINQAVLWGIERGSSGGAEVFVTLANWYSGEGTPPLPVGMHSPLDQFPATGLVLTDEPLFFRDIEQDEWMDAVARAAFQEQNVSAMALLPLWVGARQLGTLMLAGEGIHGFTEREIRSYRALAGQMAIAIENLRLLDETGHRAALLETAVQVSRAASSILDMNDLLTTSVNLVRDRFDFYYVGLFLVDETGEFAALRAGTGEAGQTMLEQGHKLPVGGGSMIGWCVANMQARIALDVGRDAVRFDNPLLPETRSEMALPLVSRGQAIGALTVQSREQAAFPDEDVAILQSMADQVANAIANVRLFEQTQQALGEAEVAHLEAEEALAEAEAVHRRYLQQEWRSFLEGPLSAQWRGFQDGPDGTVPVLDGPAFDGAATIPVVSAGGEDGGHRRLVVPIKLRDEIIGTIDLSLDDDRGWSEGDQALAESFADQLALAIENARLLEQTQFRAQRERLTREITDKIRGQTDLNAILQTTVRELGKVLGTSGAAIRLGTEADLGSPPTRPQSGEG